MRANLPLPPDPEFRDDAGRQWFVYCIQFRHEIDDMTLSAYILAIDYAHACEQLEYIRSHGYVSNRIEAFVPNGGAA